MYCTARWVKRPHVYETNNNNLSNKIQQLQWHPILDAIITIAYSNTNAYKNIEGDYEYENDSVWSEDEIERQQSSHYLYAIIMIYE